MHKIYVDHGKFNLIYQIPQILYSLLISSFINVIIKSLSLPQRDLLNLKQPTKNINEAIEKTKKCLIIKVTLFFIFTFLLLIIFWFYISCFCAVYRNTQIFLIKDTIISFCLSFVYPLGFCLLPGMLRIPSLRAKKQDKSCLYKISLLIQLI